MHKNMDETRKPIIMADIGQKTLLKTIVFFFFETTAVYHIPFDSRNSLCIRKYVTDAAITFSLIFCFFINFSYFIFPREVVPKRIKSKSVHTYK